MVYMDMSVTFSPQQNLVVNFDGPISFKLRYFRTFMGFASSSFRVLKKRTMFFLVTCEAADTILFCPKLCRMICVLWRAAEICKQHVCVNDFFNLHNVY